MINTNKNGFLKMKKFNLLYQSLMKQARGYLERIDLQQYPQMIRNLYTKFSELRSKYFELKNYKLKQLGIRTIQGTQKSVIINDIINLIASSEEKNEDTKELKQKLSEYYNNNKVSIQDWKRIANILKQVKNDQEIKKIHGELIIAYNKLPATMKKLIDLPDKSVTTIVDDILYYKKNQDSYNGNNIEDINVETAQKWITIAKNNFDIRKIAEQNVYSLINKHSDELFVIQFTTASGREVSRLGKLHVTTTGDYTVKNPLEASLRLSKYNNITYYDLSSQHPGYRNAKLSNVISISLGDFENGNGITYILEH